MLRLLQLYRNRQWFKIAAETGYSIITHFGMGRSDSKIIRFFGIMDYLVVYFCGIIVNFD